jgi:glycosyltransferase involved in cell wall biosynthesis
MTDHSPSIIYVDARALQDPDYRFRGVGQHSSSLIDALRRREWPGRRPRLVAVTEVNRESLQDEHHRLFDAVITQPRPAPVGAELAGAIWYLNLSPMTHDPVWAQAFLNAPSIYRVALFYDLIPLDFPERYLVQPGLRMDYVVTLAWLRRYDTFAAISRFSAEGLIHRMATDSSRVFVSGVAVRRSLEPAADAAPEPRSERGAIIVSGGGDARKNPECALIAHAESKILRDAGVRISVFGAYPETMRADFRAIYARHGGRSQDLKFLPHLSDKDLHEVYRRGLVTIVPSRAEGFSIPIVESSAAGTPVLASDVGAHPELARDASWRFDPDDATGLRLMLERLFQDEDSWGRLQQEQAQLWREYTVERVGRNFVEGVLARAPKGPAAPAVRRGVKPSIAILTPLPPAPSGVADYSAATLRPLTKVADVHMFTNTPGAHREEDWASLLPISARPYSLKSFDATVCVMGNSNHHTAVLDYLLDHGGACIAHDARQLDFYVHERGIAHTLRLAQAEYKKPVTEAQIGKWLVNQRELPVLFLSEIVRASSPLMVHSPLTAGLISDLYDSSPVVLPFAQYRTLPGDVGSLDRRRASRKVLGLNADEIVIVTFGHLSHDKGTEDLVWALKLLTEWGMEARLVFCGDANPDVHAHLRERAVDLGIGDRVTTFGDRVPEHIYIAYLDAADVGIQLRGYFMGGLSGALNDCIAAGLPSIANAHLASAMVAPDYVRRVPDNFSSVLIAEAAVEILDSGQNLRRPIEARAVFSARHSPTAYCRELLAALSLEEASKALT